MNNKSKSEMIKRLERIASLGATIEELEAECRAAQGMNPSTCKFNSLRMKVGLIDFDEYEEL